MIVCRSLMLAFVCVPRTASGSVAKHLMDKHGAVKVGKSVHDIDPRKARGLRVFATVRNPYGRMASWWRWALNNLRTGRKDIPVPYSLKDAPFIEFLGWFRLYQSQAKRRTRRKFCASQARFLDRINVDALLHFETLEQDARAYGILRLNETLPWVHRTDHRDWRTLYGAEETELVRSMCQPDFERLGCSEDIE